MDTEDFIKVTFVLKRLASDSIVRVPANEAIQSMAKSLGKMIAYYSRLKIAGADTTVDGVEAAEIIDECKETFQKHLAMNLSEALGEMGEGWEFEDLLMTNSTEE